MRQEEDKKLRNFEIQQWFLILRANYLRNGMSLSDASEQAYHDIGIRFCLRKSSIQKARKAQSDQADILLFEMKSNLTHLKKTIQILEQAINENK